MKQFVIPAMLWFSVIGSGLIGGLYFAFSAFIMTSLGRLDQTSGIAAMNAINVDIQRSLFMPIFLGSTLVAAILAIIGLLRWGEPYALSTLLGGIIYVVGMTVVTMVFNVPLNNALAKVPPGTPEATALWARYLKDWTLWNSVRTWACLIATVFFVLSLMRWKMGQ
ncbi:MAG: anthrone oxygenase family protein [Usitatibacteraceae bacterium]